MTEDAKHPYLLTPIDNLVEGFALLRQQDAYVANTLAAQSLDQLTGHLWQLKGDLLSSGYSPEVYLDRKDCTLLNRIGLFLENDNWCVSRTGELAFGLLGLTLAFNLGTQEKYRFLAELSERAWYKRRVGDPYVDKALFRQLQRTLFWSASGEVVDRHIHKNNVPVRFREVPADDRYTEAGSFTHDPSSLTGDITVCIRPDYTKSYLAEVLLHEGWHSRQIFHFPELFQARAAVDRFVAIKLIEHEAYAVERVHNGGVLKAKRQARIDIRQKPETPTIEAVTYMVDRLDGCSSENVGDFGTEMMRLNALSDGCWRHYEKSSYSYELMRALQAGNFRERVANNQFMQADFLTRFCVDPKGNSWLPSDPEPFFAELRDCISTLHEPMLIRAERTARKQHLVVMPSISQPALL